jgi:hypothetical protein
MSHVVAFLDQGTCRTYRSLSDVPAGAAAFSSPTELAVAAATQDLDEVRRRLVGDEYFGKSSSRGEAARRLWQVLSLGVTPDDWQTFLRRKDKLGNNKIQDESRVEIIEYSYAPGKDYMRDFFYKKLPKQAKTCMDILLEDGRGIWTGEDAMALIVENQDRIETKQGARLVFKYYRPFLFQWKLLKRVTFEEFATSSEYQGLALVPARSEQPSG